MFVWGAYHTEAGHEKQEYGRDRSLLVDMLRWSAERR